MWTTDACLILFIRSITLLSGKNLINLSDSDPGTFHECKYHHG